MEAESTESTFVFADLAGFTALTEAHGDVHAAELAGDFCGLVRGLLAEHEGEEIKTIGDAVMLRCADAAAAVELGLRILEEVAARDEFPVVRVGMHTGTAVERGGDWFGTAVNLAARIAGVAGGNEVLLSEATVSVAGELPGVQVQTHGLHRLKNVPGQTTLYLAVREGAETADVSIDPVCRMAVAPDRAAGRLTHDGREYRFCSLECVRAFAARPEDYVSG
jgi:adenylate cyclase